MFFFCRRSDVGPWLVVARSNVCDSLRCVTRVLVDASSSLASRLSFGAPTANDCDVLARDKFACNRRARCVVACAFAHGLDGGAVCANVHTCCMRARSCVRACGRCCVALCCTGNRIPAIENLGITEARCTAQLLALFDWGGGCLFVFFLFCAFAECV